MDDAQKRAADFNTEQRIAELEAEIRRLRKTLPDRLKALFDQAEADGLYEALDVTPEQVRNVELEAELADKDAEIARLRRALEDLETQFVNALADDAAAHPEKLGDVGDLIKGDDELLDKP